MIAWQRITHLDVCLHDSKKFHLHALLFMWHDINNSGRQRDKSCSSRGFYVLRSKYWCRHKKSGIAHGIDWVIKRAGIVHKYQSDLSKMNFNFNFLLLCLYSGFSWGDTRKEGGRKKLANLTFGSSYQWEREGWRKMRVCEWGRKHSQWWELAWKSSVLKKDLGLYVKQNYVIKLS